MKPIKVLLAFGTRPEAIKMAPLVKVLQSQKEYFETIVAVTGQHRQMLDQVLSAFEITPDIDLSLMKQGQTLYDVTSNVLFGMKQILEEKKPDIVLVHGDTTTTFATALAAFYQQIPVGHVEAGLRTYNIYSPFPEEFNRQSVGAIATLHFAPTEMAKQNLLQEQKRLEAIFVTGNTAIDALKTTVVSDYSHPILEWVGESPMILLTAHRRENLGVPMRNMFKAIRRIVEEHSELKVVYPMHLNPLVQESANEILGNHPRIRLIEPLEVLDFHNFLNHAHIILTDSGGIQEEAPSLGKPVLVMRDTTERPEGIAAGTLKLVGTDEATIYYEFKKLLTDELAYAEMSQAANPYGDGEASNRIAKIIKNWFNQE